MNSPKKTDKNFMDNMNNNERTVEMTQWVKMLMAKPEDLSLIPGIHMTETT